MTTKADAVLTVKRVGSMVTTVKPPAGRGDLVEWAWDNVLYVIGNAIGANTRDTVLQPCHRADLLRALAVLEDEPK